MRMPYSPKNSITRSESQGERIIFSDGGRGFPKDEKTLKLCPASFQGWQINILLQGKTELMTWNFLGAKTN